MKCTLNVQGICDYEGKFIDVDCRWPGSVHDANVFSNSTINKMFRDGSLPLLHRSLLLGFDKIPVLLHIAIVLYEGVHNLHNKWASCCAVID